MRYLLFPRPLLPCSHEILILSLLLPIPLQLVQSRPPRIPLLRASLARCAAATAVPMATTSTWTLCATARPSPMRSPARRSSGGGIAGDPESPWSLCWDSKASSAATGRRSPGCRESSARYVCLSDLFQYTGLNQI